LPDPFEDVIACLRRDGLADHAGGFDRILHQTAWTTGSEMLGELGLELKRQWPAAKAHGSKETKRAFKAAARVVRKSWPLYML
jgi:hypothetical protein